MSIDFQTVSLDPPWPEHGGGKIKRGADRHYPLVPVKHMCGVISLAEPWPRVARDAHMYMWVTNNYLPDGLGLMRDLGFRYVTNIAWIKDRSGLGQYFRGKHELILFGVRGDGIGIRTDRRDLDTVLDEGGFVEAPRGKHSAKPTCFHELIEARSPGPYLEMFARSQRDGWTSWGNEAESGPGSAKAALASEEGQP